MQRIFALTMFMVAMILLPPSLNAAESRASISATVREICRFDASPLLISEGQNSARGEAFEMCNSARSYRITATTRSLVEGESAQLGYGAEKMELKADGNTFVIQRQGPVVITTPLQLVASYLFSPLFVTLAMSAV